MDRRTIVRFAPDGRFEGTIGASGDGPGEFALPGAIVVLPGDTLLAVGDINRRILELFVLPSGRFRGEVTLPGQDLSSWWEFPGGEAEFALHMSPGMLGRWHLGDSAVASVGTLPAELLAHPEQVITHGRPAAVTTASGLAIFYPAEPRLLLIDGNGNVRGTVRLPAARRVGEPTTLLTAPAAGRSAGPPKLTPASSADGAQRRADGSVLLAHLDVDRIVGPDGKIRMGDFRLWVSLLRPDLSAACVDGLVPVTTDIPPVPVFRGDTIFVLGRRVLDDGKVRSVVYAFDVGSAGCDWIPTGGVISEGAGER
ncbi:MAG TPA: hypothetical protein VFI13_01760, partial [Gemmatimonadales bacterium]|nr:hypothetical protein [Gemmatimonadales bacterium]